MIKQEIYAIIFGHVVVQIHESRWLIAING